MAIAWAVCVAALAFDVVAMILLARNSGSVGPADDLHIADLWLAVLGPVVGASLVARDPRSPMGWVVLSTAFMAPGLAASQYALYATTMDGGAPGAVPAAWLATWTWVPFLALPMLLALLYPDSRPAWPRWLLIVVIGDVAALVVLCMVHPGAFDAVPQVRNPLGIEAAPWLDVALSVVVGVTAVVLIPGCLLAAVLRWRRTPYRRRSVDSAFFEALCRGFARRPANIHSLSGWRHQQLHRQQPVQRARQQRIRRLPRLSAAVDLQQQWDDGGWDAGTW